MKAFPWNRSRLLVRALSAFSTAVLACLCGAQVAVTTYHNDNLRTGWNSNETILTATNVRAKNFGLLFSLPVDGQVYAQPLYLPNVTIPGKGVHNVVYVATEHNTLYAFDADSNLGANSQPLWTRSFGPSVPSSDLGTDDITNEVGITSTPVIYMRPNGAPSLYLVAKSKSLTGDYTQTLYSISPSTGLNMAGSPRVISGRVVGTGDGSSGGYVNFDPKIQHSRSALLLVPPAPNTTDHAKLYVAFASHGDNGPYHGWVFVYDAENLAPLKFVNTTPNGLTDPSGYPIAAGGIWQAGCGPASDGNSVFFSTGNGKFDPATGSFGDSILRLDAKTYRFLDYFAPSNQQYLDDYDADLGSGGVMLFPPAANGTSGKKLMVQAGKEGTIYIVDTANMGHFGATDAVYQELKSAIGAVFGCPAYFHNMVYFGPAYSGLVSYIVVNGKFTKTAPSAVTSTYYQFPGPTPSISSNGDSDGIVWAIQTDGYQKGDPAILHAYNAMNVASELYNSAATQGRDTIGPAVKFCTPTVANGKVYVGSNGQVGVYGLGTWAAAPAVVPATSVTAGPVKVQMADATAGAKIYYTLDGSTPTQNSTPYTAPFTISQSTTLKARAYLNGVGASAVTQRDYMIAPVIGTGVGLRGYYYAGIQDPAGTPTATRIDPTIDFNWNGTIPIAGLGGNNWAAEWKGSIQAESSGPYTFTTNSDDGVRVYIDGNLIIDDYNYHASTLDSATVNFTVGSIHSIDVKFFQGGGASTLQLFWSAPGLPKQIVPSTQLYAPSG